MNTIKRKDRMPTVRQIGYHILNHQITGETIDLGLLKIELNELILIDHIYDTDDEINTMEQHSKSIIECSVIDKDKINIYLDSLVNIIQTPMYSIKDLYFVYYSIKVILDD